MLGLDSRKGHIYKNMEGPYYNEEERNQEVNIRGREKPRSECLLLQPALVKAMDHI
jgi:hypothetical protein